MSYIINALLTIVHFVIGMYLLIVMLRFLFQLVRAEFSNPISQTIFKLTQTPIKILRRFIPGYRGIDWPSIILLFAIQSIEICAVSLLLAGIIPHPLGLLLLCFANLLKLLIYIYIVMILFIVLISWINPGAYNPMTQLVYQLIAPLMRPIQKKLPTSTGIDFSPMVALLLLYITLSIIVAPLMDAGYRLSGLTFRLF